MSDELGAWRYAVRQYLESLASAGLLELPRVELPPPMTAETSLGAAVAVARGGSSGESAAPRSSLPPRDSLPRPTPVAPAANAANAASGAARPAPRIVAPTGDAPPEANRPYPPSLDVAARCAQLELLAHRVAGCALCPRLVEKRRRTVFGEGSPTARVAFFGEAPGAEEDATGRPFVGPAGQLLDKMIGACGFDRADVYILNTLKCRPPFNDNPRDDESENCRPFWMAQLELIRPDYIVCLGAFAVRALLGAGLSIGKLRGAFHRYRDSKVVVTYHPSYLLRTPSAKKLAWDDLKLMLADMGIDPNRPR